MYKNNIFKMVLNMKDNKNNYVCNKLKNIENHFINKLFQINQEKRINYQFI